MMSYRVLIAAAMVVATVNGPSAAPDQTQGMALMSAMVKVTGELDVGSSGVISAARLFDGTYTVTFARDVTSCTFVANVATTQVGLAYYDFSVSVGKASAPETLDIYTYYQASRVDRPFGLIVFCSK